MSESNTTSSPTEEEPHEEQPDLSETIVDHIRKVPAQQLLVEQLIQKHIETNLSSDYKPTYFGNRIKNQF
jgi:hypothetical protein